MRRCEIGPLHNPFHNDLEVSQKNFDLVSLALTDVESTNEIEMRKKSVNFGLHK